MQEVSIVGKKRMVGYIDGTGSMRRMMLLCQTLAKSSPWANSSSFIYVTSLRMGIGVCVCVCVCLCVCMRACAWVCACVMGARKGESPTVDAMALFCKILLETVLLNCVPPLTYKLTY